MEDCVKEKMKESFSINKSLHVDFHILHKIQKQLFRGIAQKNCFENLQKVLGMHLWRSNKLEKLQAFIPKFN